jgi:hypothetical protein
VYTQHLAAFEATLSNSVVGVPRALQSHLQLSGSFGTAIVQLRRACQTEIAQTHAWSSSSMDESSVDVLYKLLAPTLVLRLNDFLTKHSSVLEELRHHVL